MKETSRGKQRLVKRVNREQMSWRAVDVERLIGEDHPARAIWALVGQNELDELFTQVLAALSKEGLIPLEQVMQDGTKIKAQASVRSYREEGTIREHLERARRRVVEMGDPRNEETNPRTKQARERARREQQERLENALQELEKLQKRKKGEKAKSTARVSSSDPQARVMHHSDGGLTLSYNA